MADSLQFVKRVRRFYAVGKLGQSYLLLEYQVLGR